jgi:hypothetical protein
LEREETDEKEEEYSSSPNCSSRGNANIHDLVAITDDNAQNGVGVLPIIQPILLCTSPILDEIQPANNSARDLGNLNQNPREGTNVAATQQTNIFIDVIDEHENRQYVSMSFTLFSTSPVAIPASFSLFSPTSQSPVANIAPF